MNEIEFGERRGRGRPRKDERQSERQSARDGEYKGRNGEVLSRSRKSGTDQFEGVRPPDGWSYQWNTVTVFNNADVVMGQQMAMRDNGWRPVPAERHPGSFVPFGKTGDIVRDGMRLEERPLEMTLEAQAEENAVARRQMQDRDESLMGAKANLRGALGKGFEMNPGRYRGTGGQLRMSIDPGVDIPSPSYKTAED